MSESSRDPGGTGPGVPAPPAPAVSLFVPLTLAAGFFMEGMDQTILVTSIPQMAASLGESPLRLSFAVTGYLLSLAVFIPVSGWMAERFGARTVFCAAIVVFTTGSALCGLATNLETLVAMRVVQGVGGALMTPVGRLILLRRFPKDQLLRAMVYISVPGMIGPTLGPLVGGFLTTYLSWRWIFYVNVPIGLIGIVLALRKIENFRGADRLPFDFRGFVMVGLGLACLQLGIEMLGHRTLPPAGVAALLVGSAVALTVYGIYAHGRENPVLDLTLLRIRTFGVSILAGGLCRIGVGAVPFLLPLMFQLGFGLNAMRSGLLTFVIMLGAVVTRVSIPFVLRLFGFRRTLIGNTLLVGAMIAGTALFQADTPHGVIVAYLFVFGFFRATQFGSMTTLGFSDLTPPVMAKATSIISVAQQMAQSLGVGIASTVLALLAGSAAEPTVPEFRLAFLIVALIPFASVAGFFLLRPDDGAVVSHHRLPKPAAKDD